MFDFSLLKARWNAQQFKNVIQQSIDDHHGIGGGLTWVLSSHDVPRHPSRYAVPLDVDLDDWLLADGQTPPIDAATAIRRGRAATMLMLALPGSAYIFQGEELGLLEVADLPLHALQDPVWHRSGGTLKGRDGCRVPMPWQSDGTSFGFGDNGSWLPQPAWFGPSSARAQDGVAGSTLELYRTALHLRRRLHSGNDTLEWHDPGQADVLWLQRPGSWHCLVNFSQRPTTLPPGHILLASGPLPDDGCLPAETAVWLSEAAADLD